MSIIELLKLTPEEVEKIVVAYCKATIKNSLKEHKIPFKPAPNLTLAAKILAFISAQPDKQCKRYEISHLLKHTPHVQRLAALEELLKSGEIKTRTARAKNNRRTTIYYIPE